MIRVAEAVETCAGCPAQWEGRTDDGRRIYARYRFGCLTVGVGRTHDEAVRAAMGGPSDGCLVDLVHGDEYDGFMSQYTLADLTAHLIEWPWSRDPR